MQETLNTVLAFYQKNHLMLMAGSALFSVVFIVMFLLQNRRHDFKTRLFGILSFIAGFAAFIGFFIGGLYFGKIFHWGDYSGFIGILVFWMCVALVGWIRTPKHLRRGHRF